MFIQKKQYLKDIQRIRVSEGRDLKNGLRLDRNERVEAWGEEFINQVFKTKPDWFLSVYPENNSLYSKLSEFHNVPPDNLILTSGIDGGIKTIFEILTSPGELIGVLSPTYAMYQVYSNLYQTNLEEITYEKNNRLSIEKIFSFLKRKPTVLFLPNPNQPIEDSINLETLENIALEAKKQNCLLFVDEAYHYFGADSAIHLINKYENIIVARTFSKAFGVPSIRLGYLISNKSNMSILSKLRFAHESNSLSNAVAEHLIDNFAIVQKYINSVIETRDKLKINLRHYGIESFGETGNYLLLDLKNSKKALDFATHMKSKKIYVKGPWKGDYSKYLTITLGPLKLMERFINEVDVFQNLK